MNNSFGPWSTEIPLSSLDDVIDYVFQGRNTETIEYDINPIIYYMNPSDYTPPLSVLDFGCGICRNAVAIAKKFPHWDITGYDNSGMFAQADNLYRLKFGSSISEVSNLQLESDWESLKLLRFDIIYANIVFQHIKEKYLNMYLSDIKKMTNTLIVHGRRFHDEIENGQHKNTWKILEKNGFFPKDNAEYSSDGSPTEHFGVVYKIC